MKKKVAGMCGKSVSDMASTKEKVDMKINTKNVLVEDMMSCPVYSCMSGAGILVSYMRPVRGSIPGM